MDIVLAAVEHCESELSPEHALREASCFAAIYRKLRCVTKSCKIGLKFHCYDVA